MFSSKKLKKLVISDSDIDAALEHLNSLPNAATRDMPNPWAKQKFIEWLIESIPEKVDYGTSFDVATGIYGHIVPLGHGYLNYPSDDRYLVILSIRAANTNLDSLTDLN